MLSNKGDIGATRDGFEWRIPEHYNIGVDICDRIAAQTPDKTAIIDVDEDKSFKAYSFEQLRDLSNQLANLLAQETSFGDRVGVLLPQCIETAASHIAVTKLGAISLPLFTLFGPEALLHRLSDSGAHTVITNADGIEKLSAIKSQLPALKRIISIDGAHEDIIDFHTACRTQSTDFAPHKSRAEDPAILIYTSGTTGKPKGALHAHRVLLGHLPGVEISHNFFYRKQMTAFGHRRTGHGLAACWMC